MDKVVNLRRVKKARARVVAANQAAANRVKHGRTAAQKAADLAQAERRQALLDGARQEELEKP